MFRLPASVGAAIAAILAFFSFSIPAYAGTVQWKISESSGEVFIDADGLTRPAARGVSLKAGDAVYTRSKGRAVIVRGGEYVVISPNSRIRLTKPEESGAITQIFQTIGSALFRIEKKATPHFGVKTPYLAAVVKGTTFNVTVTQAGATVQVTEGRVEVSTLDGGAGDLIVPGRIARVDANDRQLLKVLGADEKSIRSPLPATAEVSVEEQHAAGASSSIGDAPQDDFAGKDFEPSSKGSDVNDDVFEKSGRGDGFSGRIGAPIAGGSVDLAVVTGGLVRGSGWQDRPNGNADNPGNGNGNGNADNPGNGNGNGNVDNPGNGNGNGNGGGKPPKA